MGSKEKRSALVKRHIVAAIVLPGFISYLYFLPPLPFFIALLTVVGVIALWEFFTMYKVPVQLKISGVVISAVILYFFCLYPDYALNSLLAGLLILLLLRLGLVKEPLGSMSEIGPLATGLFYITGFLSFQWLLRMEANGLGYLFLLYFSVWLSDSMALYVGTYLGKTKLYPSISPNKTVEGAFGSVAGGVLGAVLAKLFFSITSFSYPAIIVIGAVIGIISMIGDLIESMFKRDAGVKDSSTIIPGHGGVLDKIDGMLTSAPVLYFIVRYF